MLSLAASNTTKKFLDLENALKLSKMLSGPEHPKHERALREIAAAFSGKRTASLNSSLTVDQARIYDAAGASSIPVAQARVYAGESAIPVVQAQVYDGPGDASIHARLIERPDGSLHLTADMASPVGPEAPPGRFSPARTESEDESGGSANDSEPFLCAIPFDEIAQGTTVNCMLLDGEQYLSAKDVTASLMQRLCGRPSSMSYVIKKWDKIYEDARGRLGTIKPFRIPGMCFLDRV